MGDEPKIEISFKEVYDEFKELSSNIRDLVTKVDGYKALSEDHEKRIRFVEKTLYMFPPTIIGVVVNLWLNFKK